MKLITIAALAAACCAGLQAQTKTGSWGDQGNGTYINPVLNADYSDPDVCRAGDKFYMVCSEFHFMGMPVLESDDMVNWKIIAQIYSRLDFPDYDAVNSYSNGSWAPSIRYHGGKFWVYFCTPTEGLFLSTAEKAEGPWTTPAVVKRIEKWEDPCPFWDDDGRAYLGHSLHGAGPIIIHRMSDDGLALLDDGLTVYTGPVAEGVKMFKKDGYYYISIPEGGVSTGWQTVLRSKNVYGPYEKKVVLEQGVTSVNGAHQGALVDTPDGDWWFYHFQSAGALGRVVHLQPVYWHDGWPVVGVDIDRNGIGEPVFVWKKPSTGKASAVHAPQSDDDFDAATLGLQWQFNHNPDNASWSLSEKPGCLALKALRSESFLSAKNTLTQKIMGASGEAVVALDVSKMAEGQRAGLCSFGSLYALAGVCRTGGRNFLFFETNSDLFMQPRQQGVRIDVFDTSKNHFEKQPLAAKVVYLKLKIDLASGSNHFYFSTDNRHFTSLGKNFGAIFSFWKGTRLGLFSYNDLTDGGTAFFNSFRYDYDGPK